MKKIVMLALVLASTSAFAATQEVKKSESTDKKEAVDCSTSVSTTVVTNADGSSTRTTKTTWACDTPGELAEMHKLMKALGMGV